jgi:hypothetical protein
VPEEYESERYGASRNDVERQGGRQNRRHAFGAWSQRKKISRPLFLGSLLLVPLEAGLEACYDLRMGIVHIVLLTRIVDEVV